jgi:hypothetical protein
MMMNIRGLILDDPEYTVHLRTLQFTGRSNASSEMRKIQTLITQTTSVPKAPEPVWLRYGIEIPGDPEDI